MPKIQPLSAKVGEVSYREKLTAQHLGQVYRYEDEYTSQEMARVIKEKVRRHLEDFEVLKKKGIGLSPFLEIGSGYGQGALTLVNKFKAEGYGTDIALGPLKGIKRVGKKLGFKKMPKILVCDAEELPFPENSFSLVFCYQTLHHFPDPELVIKEVQRVLIPGGHFFFAEEPVAQTINLNLWKRPTKLRWWEKVLKYCLVLIFVSKIGKTEIDQGILEEAFSLKTWKRVLEVFDKVEAELTPFPNGVRARLVKDRKGWKSLSLRDVINRGWIWVLGGGITGVGEKKLDEDVKITNRLPVPKFPGKVIDGVQVVLKRELLKKLYKSS